MFSQGLSDVAMYNTLVNINWKPVKVVEFFNNETTVYSDYCVQKSGYKALNGFWRVYPIFSDDSLFICNVKRLTNTLQEYTIEDKGKWYVNNNFLIVDLDMQSKQLKQESENAIFFGNMKILVLSDTELILEKYIDRLGKWKRTFYFKKD